MSFLRFLPTLMYAFYHSFPSQFKMQKHAMQKQDNKTVEEKKDEQKVLFSFHNSKGTDTFILKSAAQQILKGDTQETHILWDTWSLDHKDGKFVRFSCACTAGVDIPALAAKCTPHFGVLKWAPDFMQKKREKGQKYMQEHIQTTSAGQQATLLAHASTLSPEVAAHFFADYGSKQKLNASAASRERAARLKRQREEEETWYEDTAPA